MVKALQFAAKYLARVLLPLPVLPKSIQCGFDNASLISANLGGALGIEGGAMLTSRRGGARDASSQLL